MKAISPSGVNFQSLILSTIARPVGLTGNSLFFSEGMELFGDMDFLQIILQVFVGLGILNVWLIRANWSTGYRGGDAKNLKEEFATYGLPVWFFYLVGTLKITFALALIAGVWIPILTLPAALGMAVLMAGAFVMHLKVKDSFNKAWPSLTVLALCLAIAAL
jgi:uncharacterized membrane protein YphA (DoxX/SURF4 family)